MRKKQIAAIALAQWLTIVFVIMLLVGQFDLEIFFVVGLIGFLVIVEIIEPTFVRPYYMQYTRYLIAAGIVIFSILIAQEILAG